MLKNNLMRYTGLEQDPPDIRGICKTYRHSRAGGKPQGGRITRVNNTNQPPRPVILTSRQYPQGGVMCVGDFRFLALLGMTRGRA